MACLPDSITFPISDSIIPKPGDKCFAAGWGNTEELGQTSEDLLELAVRDILTFLTWYKSNN